MIFAQKVTQSIEILESNCLYCFNRFKGRVSYKNCERQV